mgnify:CR=1 FL=1
MEFLTADHSGAGLKMTSTRPGREGADGREPQGDGAGAQGASKWLHLRARRPDDNFIRHPGDVHLTQATQVQAA